jgi:K+-transporting ATPase ATPase A chain
MLLFILVAKPTGVYLEKAFQGSKTLDKVFGHPNHNE